MRAALVTIGLLVGTVPSASAQKIGVDSESAVARSALRPVSESPTVESKRSTDSYVATRGLSRSSATALGFVAGAAAGIVIAHIVNQNKRTGEGKLENYIGIPLGLGLFTAVTVFVATGD